MRILLIIILSLSFFILHAQLEKKSRLYTRIDSVWYHFEELDLDPYIDEPAAKFFKEQDAPFVFKQLLPPEQAGYVGMLRLIYPEGVYVDMYVQRFEHVNPNGLSDRRKVDRFSRETVSAIRIHNELACLNGCD